MRVQDTRNSTSSHTDSLLGLPEARLGEDSGLDHYPPRPQEDEKPRATDDSDPEAALLGPPNPSEQKRPPIQIPTRDQVEEIKRNPRKRPRHACLVSCGLVGLLGIAWLTTWLMSLGVSVGGQIQVILMISDGMGKRLAGPSSCYWVLL